MKKILMALCAILTGCADYIPERPLPAARVGARLSKVCDVDYGVWLLVAPSDPVWVTETMPALFEVRSNTEWRIE